jgi:hypothetical protein
MTRPFLIRQLLICTAVAAVIAIQPPSMVRNVSLGFAGVGFVIYAVLTALRLR